jgi:uncharacterized protein (TIGR02246 family)
MDIEERVRRLEDLAEIQQLCVDYGRLIDRGEFAAYAELFCEDGELVVGGTPQAKGREAIRSSMEQSLGSRIGQSAHQIGAPSVKLDGDRATGEVQWTVLAPNPAGGMTPAAMGHHVDELAREGGRWRFRRREIRFELPRPRE